MNVAVAPRLPNEPHTLYTRRMLNTPTKHILNLVLDADLLSRIDDFWHAERLQARTQAIRALIELGLAQQNGTPKKKPVKKAGR
jgi:hypothetical protein